MASRKSFTLMQVYLTLSGLCAFLSQIYGDPTVPETLSLELGVNNAFENADIVEIPNPPRIIIPDMVLTVDYQCSRERIVGIELIIIERRYIRKTRKVFQKSWRCTHSKDAIHRKMKRRRVRLKLPDYIAYRPDSFNNFSLVVTESKLQAWNLDPDWWPSARKAHDAYFRSSVKVSYNVDILPPYSRSSKEGLKICSKWPYKLLSDLNWKRIQKCPYEKEIIEVVRYPAAINGLPYGIVRSFDRYNNPVLEKRRQKLITRPFLTISIWMYILEYCEFQTICSVMYKTSWNNTYLSPLIFLTQEGKLHIQMQTQDSNAHAALTPFSVPRQEWCRVVIKLTSNTWTVALNFGENFQEEHSTTYTAPIQVYLDDAEGVYVIGGLDLTYSFRGYIGQATIYRNRALDPHQIPMPSPFHPMFELGLTKREGRCIGFISWVNRRYQIHKYTRRKEILEQSCNSYFLKFVKKEFHNPENQCSTYKTQRPPKSYAYLDRLMKRIVRENRVLMQSKTADKLYKKAMQYVDQGLPEVRKAAPLLRQSACLGNPDAMFAWAVILNNGVTMKADEIQAQAYLMMGALDKHRLCCLALANKHKNGLDGVPADREQSYMYYKYVADKAREDKDIHRDTDVYTESVRLTDEVLLKEQTDEEGDIYQWLKHQAGKGVVSAQKQVARLLFWGQQGMKRNIEQAVEYYRMGAEAEDPQAMYDYGIVLLRGQGVEKNESKGLSHIQESAEKRHPDAINALGWYAMNFKHNVTEAAMYFEEAYSYGQTDAAYNLGSLHLNGQYPGKPADFDLALNYFVFAGERQQLEAGSAIASIHIKGTSMMKRSVHVAVEWSRFTAEKTPAIGILLRKGLHAFRRGDIPVSLFYYLMTAEAGTEIGSFNLAFLCEDNKEGVTASLEKECQWRHFNQSIQREEGFIDSYALIKMGDYFWYGCEQKKDNQKAAMLYTRAAMKGDPHAIFNLAFMLEEGVKVNPAIWTLLNIPVSRPSNTYDIRLALYNRCKYSPKTEAYLPCSLALYKVQALQFWETYYIFIKVVGFISTLAVTVVSVISIVNHLRSTNQRQLLDDV